MPKPDFSSNELSDSNPYSPPSGNKLEVAKSEDFSRMLRRSILTIVVMMVLFGIGGACVGWGIGYIAPGYYRAVFSDRAALPGFSPTDVGLGLGLSQGIGMGFVVGCVSVFVAAYYQSRVSKVLRSHAKTSSGNSG